ncbi:MAG: hypothetical protein GY715_21935 [Planctomycetes bacterium]|nr:hypothetical protein [Planctomycetota bacterium]
MNIRMHARTFVAIAAGGLAAGLCLTGDAGVIGGDPSFVGAAAGIPVEFDVVPLPPVTGGPGPSPGAITPAAPSFGIEATPRDPACPFAPTFGELVTGETIITSSAQMRAVWSRLFDTPYPSASFDFNTSYVVLMGGGLMHPWFGFEIAAVDEFEATFADGGPFPTNYLEYPLAVVAVTTFPGVKPPPMDPVHKVSAVRIPKTFLRDVIFNRQDSALP